MRIGAVKTARAAAAHRARREHRAPLHGRARRAQSRNRGRDHRFIECAASTSCSRCARRSTPARWSGSWSTARALANARWQWISSAARAQFPGESVAARRGAQGARDAGVRRVAAAAIVTRRTCELLATEDRPAARDRDAALRELRAGLRGPPRRTRARRALQLAQLLRLLGAMKAAGDHLLYGHQRGRARAATRTSTRCAPNRPGSPSVASRMRRSPAGSARSTGLESVQLPRELARLRLPQQPARGARAGAGRLSRRGRRGRARSRRAPHRRVHRHQHLGHPADRARLPRARRGRRIAARLVRLPRARRTPSRSPTSCGQRLGLDGAATRGLRGLLLERQGVRHGGARHRSGLLRRGRGRRRRQPVPDHAVRLQFAAARLARHLPAVGCGARRHVDRRSRRLRAARARADERARRRASARRIQRCAPHVAAAPGGRGRGAGDARGALGDARSPRASTTSTCTAPARPRTTRPKTRR